MTTIDVKYENDKGEEVTLTLPARFEVCDDCCGEGYVLCDGMRGHAYSQEEFEEAFDDDEDREAYFTRGGKYDQVCPTCAGKNVVPVIDEENIPAKLKAQYEQYEKQAEEAAQYEAEYQAECAMERRFGC